jgi:histidyl-tRNA synthetase
VSGQPDKLVDITVAIDKIDKIGLDAVKQELFEKGLSEAAVAVIEPVLTLSGSTEEKLAKMRELLAGSEVGLKGLDEVGTLFGLIAAAGISQPVELDLSLARGLNYYTGAIFEVKALDFAIGSICGGGRYDDLTGIFGLPNMSGVGISFGADRIYDVLLGLNLFPQDAAAAATVLFTNMGEKEVAYAVPVAATLRAAGIACEIYPDNTKLKKQFEYADRKGIPFLAIVGDQEVADGTVTLKNLASGEQRAIAKEALAEALS